MKQNISFCLRELNEYLNIELKKQEDSWKKE